MRFYILIFMGSIILIANSTFAQTIEWQKSYGGSAGDNTRSIIPTLDKGFIVVGNTNSNDGDVSGNHGGNDCWVVKLDSNGVLEWQKCYGGSGDEWANSVVQTSDRGFIFTGFSSSNDGDVSGNHGGNDYWIVKLDSSGVLEWQKCYGGSGTDNARSVAHTVDKGFVLEGFSDSNDGDVSGNHGGTDYWVVKLDSSGVLEWQNCYGGSEIETGLSIMQILDNGFILTGYSSSNDGDVSGNHGGNDYWVVKLDSSGVLEWQNCYGGSGNDFGRMVRQSHDKGFILTGYSDSNDGDVSGNHGGSDCWVVKIDSNGVLEWQESYGGSGYDVSYSIFQSMDEGFIFSGFSDSNDGNVIGNHGSNDCWIVKLDNNGEVEWQKCCGGSGSDVAYSMTKTLDEGVIIACWSNSNDGDVSGNHGGNDYWVLKFKYTIYQSINILFNVEKTWYDTDYDGIELGNIDVSNSTIDYGKIVSFTWTLKGDTIADSSNLDIALPTGTHKLIVTAKSDKSIEKRDSIFISVYSSKLETTGPIYSAVSMLDNDKLFISSMDDRIYRFDSTGTSSWTILTGGSIRSTNCIGNQNSIYVGSTDTRLYSFNQNGNPNWDRAMGGVIESSPSIGVDGTIYVGISTGRMTSVKSEGTFLWSIQTGGAIVSSPAVSVNGIIYFGSTDGKFYASNSLGDTLWTFTTGDSIVSSPALGIDSSVVFGSNDGYLYKLKSTGELLWKFKTGGKIVSSPVIGQDGNILFGSYDSKFYSLSKEGSEIWSYDAGNPITGSPSIGENGRVYFGCEDGIIMVVNSSGILEWYLQTEGIVVSSPLITNNGLIYVGSTDGNVYVMKEPDNSNLFKNTNSTYEWYTFKGNNQRTGFQGEIGTSVESKVIILPKTFSISQNYPNPFNPITKIKFALPKSEHVLLNVYNTLGQRVITLNDTRMNAGYYEVQFDGIRFSSGVYLYSIQMGSFKDIKKMILLK